MMMRRTPMASVLRQRGRTVLVVLSAVLAIGALALLFIYLPYGNPKGEAELQALKERRQNFERQAEELQQKQVRSWNDRQARQRRLEQEREVQKKE
jgi:hypothetical protein